MRGYTLLAFILSISFFWRGTASIPCSKTCKHDISTPEIIKSEGYPSEVHHVTTDDGYILELHRIPHGKDALPGKRPVVFIQHGMLSSSADFVIATPKKALGMILADAGYDVWLGNFRGNTYSRRHETLKPSRHDFWKFTWDQMAKYDLPAMINKVLEVTNQSKLHYIGHSMGTTTFMVMMNLYPEMSDKFNLVNFLSPVAYVGHTKSPIKYILAHSYELGDLFNHFGFGEFLPSRILMDILSALFCRPFNNKVCESVVFLLCGFDGAQMNDTLLPTIVRHTPAGTSTYTVLHYGQEMLDHKFRGMDWGEEDNLEIHGSIKPPTYDISKVNATVAVYRGANDWLAQESDVIKVLKNLPILFDNYLIPYKDWNHADFLWAIDADKLLYSRILKNLKAFEKKYSPSDSEV